MVIRRWRFYYRLLKELSTKYKSSLYFGLILGFAGSIAISRLGWSVWRQLFNPVERIGLVGEFTPSTLPLPVQHLISHGLTEIDSDGSPRPALAASWEATDSGKTYIFHLRTDPTWHNGDIVEAKDVNYNIRDVSFVPIDSHTLKATLKDAYSPFLTLVAKPIIQKGLRGIGPYRVSRVRLKGDMVVYLRLEPVGDHDVTSKEYRFYRTETQAITAYKMGDVDRIEELSTVTDLKNWGAISVQEKAQYDRIVALYFNLEHAQLSEKSFRQALGYAVPNLPYERATSPISKTSWAYSSAVKTYSFDESQIKRLLKNSKSATTSAQLTITTFAPFVDDAQAIAQQWTSAGVLTSVKITNDVPKDYQVVLSVQTIPPDPDQYAFWHSTQKDTNITGYVNLKIDKLLEDGRQELDQDIRKKIYADIAKRIVEDAPAVFLYYPKSFVVERRK